MTAEFNCTNAKAGPNRCSLSDNINIEIAYTIAKELSGAVWRFRFIADVTHMKVIVECGKTDEINLDAGEHVLQQTIMPDLCGIPKSTLDNTCLLSVALVGNDGVEVGSVDFSINVYHRREDRLNPELLRHMISPI